MVSLIGGLISFYAVLRYSAGFRKIVFLPLYWFDRQEIIELANTILKVKTKIYFLFDDNEGDADVSADLNNIDALS